MFYRVAYYIHIFRFWLVNAFEIRNFYIAPSRNFPSGNKQTNKKNQHNKKCPKKNRDFFKLVKVSKLCAPRTYKIA